MIKRILGTLILFAVWGFAQFTLAIPSTLTAGSIGRNQFENSDSGFVNAMATIRLFSAAQIAIDVVFILLLLLLWLKPIRAAIASLMAGVLALCLLGSIRPAGAYYDKTDYAEYYFILPNESAFFIPDAGANRDSQSSFGSEAYLKENKIAAKRFQVPHGKAPGSSWFSDYYVPTGRLIIVDRTPYNREWVAQAHRGTSQKDESFPCQSKEGLNISVGIAIGASVFEEDAARFLYRFGVKPPQGDRGKPEVIFTSVFYGRSVAEVMDGPVRSKITSLVCNEFTKRTFDEGNSQAFAIMASIQQSATEYLRTVGITLDYIGWADTFTFDHAVQDVINRRYVASQEAAIASQLAPQTATLQALATAEATRTTANKWNGQLPSSVSLWWLPSSLTEWFSSIGKK